MGDYRKREGRRVTKPGRRQGVSGKIVGPKLPRVPRVCLRCQKHFSAIGPFNRLCPACSKYAEDHGGGLEPIVGVARLGITQGSEYKYIDMLV